MFSSSHDVQGSEISCSKHFLSYGWGHSVGSLDSGVPESSKNRIDSAFEQDLIGLEDTVAKVESTLRNFLSVFQKTRIMFLKNDSLDKVLLIINQLIS